MAEKSVTPAVKQQAAPLTRSEPVQLGAPVESLLALQKSAGNRAVRQLLSRSPGQPLDAATRRWMEAHFQADFSTVRVHTSAEAAHAASDLGAKAFTYDQHIAFSAGRYAPSTHSGKRLLAHELSHTLQNRRQVCSTPSLLLSLPDSPAEIEADRAASHLDIPFTPPAIQAQASATVQLSPEEDLVNKHTSWNFLNEKNLGAELLALALKGNYEIAFKVMDYLGSTDRDDVSEAFAKPATNEQLDQMAKTEQGRRLLDRLYDELTSGSIDSDEQKQVDRIIAAKTRQISPEDFLKGKEKAKIFPYRKPGLTVLNDAPIIASLKGKGKVYIKIPVRVWGYDKYRRDTKTLPTEVFIGGIELPENEIVGVRLYDEGGKVVYYPALYLIQIGNKSTADTFKTIGEAGALGLSFGSGALIGAGAKGATWGARALLYADRAATVLGAVTSVINDHRGWFIERFGERGRAFVETMDTVNSVVAIYGIGRVVFGMGKLLNSLRKSYQQWRKAAKDAEKTLDSVETKRIHQVDTDTQDFLKQVEQAEAAQKAERAAGASGQSPTSTAPSAPKGQPPAEAPASKRGDASKIPSPPSPAKPVQAEPAQQVKSQKAQAEVGQPAAQNTPAATPAEMTSEARKNVETRGIDVPESQDAASEQSLKVASHRYEAAGDEAAGRLPGLEPTDLSAGDAAVVKIPRKPHGFSSHRNEVRKRVTSGGMEDLERTQHKKAPTLPRRDPTREEQLAGIPFEWEKVRRKTPTQDLRDWVRSQLPEGSPDPALPGRKVIGPAQPDHIVPVDEIRRMPGFAQLDDTRQLKVLNMREYFVALSPSANASKGSKSFKQWKRHEELGIDVDPSFRQQMMAGEEALKPVIQEEINQLLKAQYEEAARQ